MRIITGKARGTKLDTLEGEETRPTLEQVKEAVFSMIQFDIAETNVLDLFAGSGQMGLEALSRGASHATFVDKSRAAMSVVERNAAKTKLADGCTFVRSDWADFIRMRSGRDKFEVVFLDPPYAQKAMPGILNMLVRYKMVRPTTIIVCETAAEDDVFGGDFELALSFDVMKRARYGSVCVTLLSPKTEEK